jgi:hypothetical protein
MGRLSRLVGCPGRGPARRSRRTVRP